MPEDKREQSEKDNHLLKSTLEGNYEDIVKNIENGANIDCVFEDGRTVIHHAFVKCQEYIVEYFLDLKPDLSIKDIYGYTPEELAKAILRTYERGSLPNMSKEEYLNCLDNLALLDSFKKTI